jgi:hypothetical protein
MSTIPLLPALGAALVVAAGGTEVQQDVPPVRARNGARLVEIAKGWANTWVNTNTFRQHAVTTHGDTQYAAFYDPEGRMLLAKRKLGSEKWETRVTEWKGNVRDAHNVISIAVDGKGVLHVAWDHHNDPLRYARGKAPGSLELTEKLPMTGKRENRVTYPEFYNLPDGDLVFMYRDGASGGGDTLLNRYDVKAGKWSVLQHPLISGEGERNAYTNQLVIAPGGSWHLSWVWRETPNVVTNHDLCYARSDDEGKTWRKSTGEPYKLPITEKTGQVIVPIKQGSDLINNVSSAWVPGIGVVIATYWRPEGAAAPQYMLTWRDGRRWRTTQMGKQTTDFKLEGTGTRTLRMARQKVLAAKDGTVYVVCRDGERGHRVCVARVTDLRTGACVFTELTDAVGMWEPGVDTVLWERDGVLHVLVERFEEGAGKAGANLPPQPVYILEWKP